MVELILIDKLSYLLLWMNILFAIT